MPTSSRPLVLRLTLRPTRLPHVRTLPTAYVQLFALAFLLATTILVYRVGLNGPFLLDDYAWNSKYSIKSIDAEELTDLMFSGGRLHDTTRGLGRISWVVTRYIYGETPYPFKVKNLLIHLCNGLLLYWFLLLCARVKEPQDDEYLKSALPLWVVAVWLLHPLHVSTVLYAVQHIVILSTFFSLIALIAYLKGRRLAARHPYAGFLLATTSVGSTVVLGLMAKETAALVPFQILLIELTLLARTPISAKNPVITKLLFAALWAAPLAAALIAFPFIGQDFMDGYAVRPFTAVERVLTEFHVVALYLKLLFIPIPGNMSLFHDSFPIIRSLDTSTALIAAVHAGLITGAVLLRRRAPWLSFGTLWFYLCHSLESTIFPLELVFEHRNYLASAGVLVATVWILLMLFRHVRTPLAKRAIVFSALALLSVNTLSRAQTWSELEKMLAVDYQSRPTSTRVLSNLAIMNANDGRLSIANRFLSELRATDPPSAGAEILSLLVNCAHPNSDAISTVHNAALQRLRHGILDAFTANTLARLIKAKMSGRCENLDTNAAHALLASASQNDRTRDDLGCLMAGIHSLFALSDNDLTSATHQLRRGIDICSRVDMTSLRMFLDAFLGQALRYESLEYVSPTLQDIAATSTTRHLMEAFPDWFEIQLDQAGD